ncbi:hypothetical protein F5884DRAFT_747749 [Xylogone sp. PMI_703]|nr:hypothetical protein F5884DRAFT_747749 [Xylogone sp. PMI_703]
MSQQEELHTGPALPQDRAQKSRFVEGDPVTGEEVQQRSRADMNGHFYHVLIQEDEHAARRRHRSTSRSSSSSSLSISKKRNSSNTPPSSLYVPSAYAKEELGKKSQGNNLRRSLDSCRPEVKEEGKLSVKIRGRLRALTHGHERERAQPYPGT